MWEKFVTNLQSIEVFDAFKTWLSQILTTESPNEQISHKSIQLFKYCVFPAQIASKFGSKVYQKRMKLFWVLYRSEQHLLWVWAEFCSFIPNRVKPFAMVCVKCLGLRPRIDKRLFAYDCRSFRPLIDFQILIVCLGIIYQNLSPILTQLL